MMRVEINDDQASKIRKIMQDQGLYGAINPQTNMKQFVSTLLSMVIDGYQREGSWEREVLDKLGLMPEIK